MTIFLTVYTKDPGTTHFTIMPILYLNDIKKLDLDSIELSLGVQ